MHLRSTLILASSLALASPLHAQLIGGTLVSDINTDPAVVGSYNGGFASNGNLVYFGGIDAETGVSYRIWRSDGTTAGTIQLHPAALNEHESTFLANGDLFSAIDELGVGVGLWRSDGTPAGTVRVAAPLDWTDEPHDLTVFGGAVWFLAGLEDSGTELWRHDLASGQTALFHELEPGPASGVQHLFAGAGKLFFAGSGTTDLWATDGTPGGAVVVATLTLHSFNASLGHEAEVGSRVIFASAGSGTNPTGWWSSDGTPGGTFLLQPTFNTYWSVQGATKVWFTAGNVASTPRLFETDGTPGGTQPVNLSGQSGGQRVDYFPGVALGDDLFYSGNVGGSGFELCRTTGGGALAQLAAEINPTGQSLPVEFVTTLGQIFFRADDGVHGTEIWSFDPISATAALVADLTPGPGVGIIGSKPTILPASGGVVFGQNFPVFGIEPAATDGVQTGLLLNIGDEGLSDGSDPTEFLRFGDRVLFQAFEGSTGAELWITDGTTAGTRLVKDINPLNDGPLGSDPGSKPHNLTLVGDRVFFRANHPDFGIELWSTDGTEAGTSLVVDLVPGPSSSESFFFNDLVPMGEALFFLAADGNGGSALWRVDDFGTTQIKATSPLGPGSKFGVLERIGDRLLFQADGPEGLELWSSDGTVAGTALLADLTPGPDDTLLAQIAVGDSLAYFTPAFGSSGELWKTDGTPAGTVNFFTLGAGEGGFGELTTLGDLVLFSVTTPANGREPWVSDGTAAGTMLLADTQPGPGSGFPLEFTVAGNGAFFAVQSPPDSFHFGQLWVTDGTPAGTQLAVDLPSPLDAAGLADFWAAGTDQRLLFTNQDANGEEWWVTDGSAAGTQALTDIALGAKSSEPRPGIQLGNRLLFAATDGLNGVELHSIPLSATGGFAVTPIGAGCAGAGGVPSLSLASGAASLGRSFALAIENALPLGSALWFFDGSLGALAPSGDCGVLLPSPKLLLATPTDAGGGSTLPLTVPLDPSLAGAVVDFQALSLELAGPFLGLGALSNGLEVVLGQ
ncbi:hypothetical protein [Engelhardtia mirabilis]|uniref:ELWxxDGT repeat protein n=1 Tax=Engelhardtia mirabilis TaxID=2528011 RepID=A0A518BGN3_9BACT|nr:hypothetical protein Pla133_12140 [Planctomycetes bacterium Pla133]QDV00475.1 hypothetical protein Pla86_12140 [Planctomycetes bacterium Pla86]